MKNDFSTLRKVRRGEAAVPDMEVYEQIYKRSLDDPERYWAERAGELVNWYKKWDTVLDADLLKPGGPLVWRRDAERFIQLP